MRTHPGRVALARPRAHNLRVTGAVDSGTSFIRTTLKRRLKQCRVVARELRRDPSDDGHVHQLRIATRRADAALRLFASSLPSKAVRRMRKRLRAVRRAAGDVRNLDVLLLRLAPANASSDAGEAAVITELRRLRKRSSRRLLRKLTRLLDKRYRRLAKRLTRSLDDDTGGQPLRPLRLLRPLTAEFARASASNLAKIDNLHRFRICGKRVRYALEILREQIPRKRYNSVIGSLKQLQEAVGTINDHHTAILLLESVRKRCDGPAAEQALERLIESEQQSLASRHAEFLKWWKNAETGQRDAILHCTDLAAS
ncbi:CHAD domain protein [Maioricimonas rarisocia]|uniref:CHAD domain protein n=1 Tax=Maioricimonas rarisocia TaxID=2528026 RepID=A0A517Z464_9PLAN|nr:CHAD domain-containing protein [Maioricimonas rarisocia]QDU37217.1 CHAD domain protein [Maioricimonas rarisocia]